MESNLVNVDVVEPELPTVLKIEDLEQNALYHLDPSSIPDPTCLFRSNIRPIELNHCFRFQLRYLYEPVLNDKHSCHMTTLIVCCPSDPEHNIFVRVLLDGQSTTLETMENLENSQPLDNYLTFQQQQLQLTMDNVGRYFEVQNFRTIKCNAKTVTAHLKHIPSIHSKLFHLLGIMISFKRFGSVLKICSENFGLRQLVNLSEPQEDQEVPEDHQEEEDVENLIIQVVDRLSSQVEDNLLARRRGNKRPIELNTTKFIMENNKRKKVEFGSEDQIGPISQRSLDHTVPTKDRSKILTTTIEEVPEQNIEEVPEFEYNLKKWFQELNIHCSMFPDIRRQVKRFLRFNCGFLEPQDSSSSLNLSRLSEVRHPFGTTQPNLYNMVVIVRSSVINFADKRLELVVFDETVPHFSMSLITFQFPPLVPFCIPKGDGGVNKQMNHLSRQQVRQLFSGDLLLIRGLEMRPNTRDVKIRHDQIRVVELNQNRFDKIVLTHYCPEPLTRSQVPAIQSLTLHKQELRRILHLNYYHIYWLSTRRLISAATNTPFSSHQCNVTDIVGQLLAKNVQPKEDRAEIYLLLTSNTLLPRSFVGHQSVIRFICEQSQQDSADPPDPIQLYRLLLGHYVLRVSVFDDHCRALRQFKSMDFIALYNVQAKPDLFYSGYTYYVQHGGDKFGRRVQKIGRDTIFGDYLQHQLTQLHRSLKENDLFDRTMLEFFLSLDDILQLSADLVQCFDTDTITLIERMATVSQSEYFLANLSKPQLVQIQKTLLFLTESRQSRIHMLVNYMEAKPIRSFLEVKIVRHGAPLFKIGAQLVDYRLECDTIGQFRYRYARFKCLNQDCNYHVPFVAMLPKISHVILRKPLAARLQSKLMTCPECFCPLRTYAAIVLFLEDRYRKRMPVLLAGCELRRLMNLDQNRLLFDEPHSREMCDTLKFVLETCKVSSEEEDRSKNQTFQWILQSVTVDQRKLNRGNKSTFESDSDDRSRFGNFQELFDPKYQLKPQVGRAVDPKSSSSPIPDQVFYVRGFTLRDPI